MDTYLDRERIVRAALSGRVHAAPEDEPAWPFTAVLHVARQDTSATCRPRQTVASGTINSTAPPSLTIASCQTLNL